MVLAILILSLIVIIISIIISKLSMIIRMMSIITHGSAPLIKQEILGMPTMY